ncbi:MAG: MBL fold metallo-hydrolase [Patescibacteria group bacterium]|nr:MBL fold metallo-hydrolase [Patescibacteria group bacterium]
MHIKKLAHCCLVIDIPSAHGKNVRILTDPGMYSLEQHDKVDGADIVLITHEHQDHFHIESLKALIKRCPDVSVISNDTVGALLAKEGIEHRIMLDGNAIEAKGVKIEAHGSLHAVLHSSIPQSSNVGFLIDGKLFMPGDAYTDPKKPVDALALPTAGPWMKMSEAIDYGLQLKPRIAFPVHDAMGSAFQNGFIGRILSQNGVEFVNLENGASLDVA